MKLNKIITKLTLFKKLLYEFLSFRCISYYLHNYRFFIHSYIFQMFSTTYKFQYCKCD